MFSLCSKPPCCRPISSECRAFLDLRAIRLFHGGMRRTAVGCEVRHLGRRLDGFPHHSHVGNTRLRGIYKVELLKNMQRIEIFRR